ncbi:MAG: DUF1573 domain-containing protein [Nonlabens sp.]
MSTLKFSPYTLATLFFFVSTSIYAQEINQLPITTVEFESKTIDYGVVYKGSEGKKSFTIKNTGSQPLKISQIFSSSHIKVLEYPRDTVAPGEIAVVEILYDTNKSGPIVKTITLHMNVKEKIVPIKITGRVD